MFAFPRFAAGAALALAVLCTAALPAAARNVCMKRAELAGVLEKHKETPAAIGLASNGSLIEVFTAEDGATWSIVMTSPEGVACVVAVGEDWDQRLLLEAPAA